MSMKSTAVCTPALVSLAAGLIHLTVPNVVIAKEKPPVTKPAVCKQPALKQTQEMIRTILNDLTKSYAHTGGGGITRIEQKATFTYVVSIAQEERVDQITYELNVSENCKATIVRRTPTH